MGIRRKIKLYCTNNMIYWLLQLYLLLFYNLIQSVNNDWNVLALDIIVFIHVAREHVHVGHPWYSVQIRKRSTALLPTSRQTIKKTLPIIAPVAYRYTHYVQSTRSGRRRTRKKNEFCMRDILNRFTKSYRVANSRVYVYIILLFWLPLDILSANKSVPVRANRVLWVLSRNERKI